MEQRISRNENNYIKRKPEKKWNTAVMLKNAQRGAESVRAETIAAGIVGLKLLA